MCYFHLTSRRLKQEGTKGDSHAEDLRLRKCPHLRLNYLKILFSRLSCVKFIYVYAEALGFSPNFQEHPVWKTSFSLNS